MPDPIPMRPDPHAPRTSWWLEAQTREQFAERALRESMRMAQSLTARKIGSMVVGSGPAVTGGRK